MAYTARRHGFEVPALHEREVKPLQGGRQVGRESRQCDITDVAFTRTCSGWQAAGMMALTTAEVSEMDMCCACRELEAESASS